MTGAVLVAFASALALAASAVLSKQLTLTMPARQLVGPLLALNALLVLPAVGVGGWVMTPQAWRLHLVEAGLLLVGSWAVWDLFDHGDAAATVTAQSLSPIPAVVVAFALLPGAAGGFDLLGATMVAVGVLLALRGAFGTLGSLRRWGTVIAAASTAGAMTITSRLLADLGVGIVATYLTRTSLAAVVAWVVFWPRDVPLRHFPQLAVRAVVITGHFLGILVAVRLGSPAVVQAVVASAPLLTLVLEALRRRRRPAAAVIAGTAVVSLGVAVMALLGSAAS
jgi:drug/metabolite transporter (DMT)-like permease